MVDPIATLFVSADINLEVTPTCLRAISKTGFHVNASFPTVLTITEGTETTYEAPFSLCAISISGGCNLLVAAKALSSNVICITAQNTSCIKIKGTVSCSGVIITTFHSASVEAPNLIPTNKLEVTTKDTSVVRARCKPGITMHTRRYPGATLDLEY